jgi:hypothetical protein
MKIPINSRIVFSSLGLVIERTEIGTVPPFFPLGEGWEKARLRWPYAICGFDPEMRPASDL